MKTTFAGFNGSSLTFDPEATGEARWKAVSFDDRVSITTRPESYVDQVTGNERTETVFNVAISPGASLSPTGAAGLGRALVAVSSDAEQFAGIVRNYEYTIASRDSDLPPNHDEFNQAVWFHSGVEVVANRGDDEVELNLGDAAMGVPVKDVDRIAAMLTAAGKYTRS